MADLTDEEKAQQVSAGVDGATQDEPTKDESQSDESKESPEESTEERAEAKTEPSEEETQQDTFPKKFNNLKGDSWDEYGPELEKAYENSTTEALRLRKQLGDLQATQAAPPTDGTQQTAPQANPDIDWLKSEREKAMLDAFGQFTKTYPQATELTSSDDAFKRFELVANGAENSFFAINGRRPTYPELFEQTAKLYGWQPADQKAQADNAIKEGAAQSSTVSSTKPVPKVNITDKELEVARRMVGPANTQDDSELLKDLAKIKV